MEKTTLIQDIKSGKNTSFCVMPWVSINGEADGDFRICCYDIDKGVGETLGNIKDMSIEQLRNSGPMREIRRKMIQGIQISRCAECYKKESIGAMSMRKRMNENYKRRLERLIQATNFETGIVEKKYFYLDVRFSNICNLACRMCYSTLSSGRIELDKRLPGSTPSEIFQGVWDTPNLFEDTEFLDGLERLYIAGGEPFLDVTQKKFVDLLVQTGRSSGIRIYYNTNLTVINEYLLQPLLSFEKVQIIISCDGYGDVFEYIRIGAKWKKFLEKLIFLKKFFSDNNKSVHLLVNAVIQRDNIHNIPKLYIFLKKYFQIDIYFEFLVNPPYLSIENIELEKRDKILRLYQEYINKYKDKIPDIEDDFKKIITVIENSSPLENHTKEYYKNTVIIDEYMHSINNK